MSLFRSFQIDMDLCEPILRLFPLRCGALKYLRIVHEINKLFFFFFFLSSLVVVGTYTGSRARYPYIWVPSLGTYMGNQGRYPLDELDTLWVPSGTPTYGYRIIGYL